jgi:hypothetical protein
METYSKTTQVLKIFRYLQNNTATASMISKATGIPRKNITSCKKKLEISGLLREVEKQKCKITGCLAWYLTCKPDFVTSNKNLDTIRKEERDSESCRGRHSYTNYI